MKWVGLNYDECYWESESDISSFQQQIENFNRLQSRHRKLKKQKASIRDGFDLKNKSKEFQQFEKSPEFLPGGINIYIYFISCFCFFMLNNLINLLILCNYNF